MTRRMAEVEDDHAAEARQPSRSTMETSNALVDLSMMPIKCIPLQPRLLADVMAAFALVQERLCEMASVHEPDA
jgi:hypothetical protein